MGFNVTKNWSRKPKNCAAMRCKDDAVAGVLGDCWDNQVSGDFVPLCATHLDAAQAAYGLGEVEGSVRGFPSVELDLDAPLPMHQQADIDQAQHHLAIELEGEAAEGEKTLASTQAFEIQSQDDLEFAGDALAEVKGIWKRLKAKQDEILKPMLEATKRTRALFKPALTHYADAEHKLKQLIGEAHVREEADRAVAMDSAAAGDTAGALANIRHTENVTGLNVRMAWDFEVTDPAAVPREFLCVDDKAIKTHIKGAENAPNAIAGVRFFEKPVTSSRSA